MVFETCARLRHAGYSPQVRSSHAPRIASFYHGRGRDSDRISPEPLDACTCMTRILRLYIRSSSSSPSRGLRRFKDQWAVWFTPCGSCRSPLHLIEILLPFSLSRRVGNGSSTRRELASLASPARGGPTWFINHSTSKSSLSEGHHHFCLSNPQTTSCLTKRFLVRHRGPPRGRHVDLSRPPLTQGGQNSHCQETLGRLFVRVRGRAEQGG